MQALDAAFNDEADMADYVKRFHPNHPVGKVSREFMADYAQITPMMRVSVPIMLFIDRKGMIRSEYFGNEPFFNPESALKSNIKAELDKLLLDDKPAAKKKNRK